MAFLNCGPWLAGLLAASTMISPAVAEEIAPTEAWRGSHRIEACDDQAEFPPYTYIERVAGVKTDIVTGISYELLATMLQRRGLSLRITLLPWKRCVEEVRTGRFHVLLNATMTPDRAVNYHGVGPHATLWTYYFYSRKLHPDGLAIRTLADLRKYRICGMMGYNSEEPYGLPKGFVDQGSSDFGSMIRKVLAGHCDLFNESLDVMQGFAKIGRPLLDDPQLAVKILPPELKPAEYYFLVSRLHPQGRALAELLDSELKQMKASGELKRLREKFLKSP
ncbi:amino acid ABC transporter substrate-binding protein [Chitinimonas arctica]|uniref:Amino acid ABC transporter substrate-binding protein n=1 Tax=Chitinimonas arctica TaxID=2594795 RepID=A0A516SAA9_9NEIS|nr:transporter substrate-binding domain-containing protein [Chitinimonas arctica]QDQ24988.1 amino acid ABC transporter substrate-binding protein [Chitinimonas arctica]